MRKNKRDGTCLAHLYTTFKVEGLNLDRFIEKVKKEGVVLYDVKKRSNKSILVTVNFKDNQKFFAIAKELCYNIIKVKDKGLFYPVYSLFRSFGLLIGGVSFVLLSVLFSDLVFSLSFSGSGSLYKNEVRKFLDGQGVKEFVRFSDLNLSKIEDDILASNPRLSFVSCKKHGNKLLIELILSDKDNSTLKGDKYSLVSDVDGEVESLKVYRGTAVVKRGDLVKKGDLLVDGIATVKEQTVKINVLASVGLICTENFTYRSSLDGEEERAKLFAEETLGDREVLFSQVEKQKVGEEFIYQVIMKYRRIITVG